MYPFVNAHLKARQTFGVLTCGDGTEGTLDDKFVEPEKLSGRTPHSRHVDQA